MTVIIPATPAQRAWVKDLGTSYELGSESTSLKLRELADHPDFSKSDASKVIDKYKGFPKKPRTPRAPGGPLASVLDGLEKAKYAVPVVALPTSVVEHHIARGQDLFFCEIREYNGHRYMRELHGAPGSFSRSKLSRDQIIAVAKVLMGRELEFTQLFGEHYSCCGVCGAELTDVDSRRLKLGPVCRVRFGL